MIMMLVVKVKVTVMIKNKQKLGNTEDSPFLVQYATSIAPWLTIHSISQTEAYKLATSTLCGSCRHSPQVVCKPNVIGTSFCPWAS